MRLFRFVSLASVMLLAGFASAQACLSSSIVASAENVTVKLNPGITKTAPNQFNIVPPTNTVSTQAFLTATDLNVGFCAEVEMLTTPTPNDSGVGVFFWSTGNSNDDFYFLELHDNGQYRVVHALFGKWYTLLPFTASTAIKQGMSQVNEVEIWRTTTGANIFINGQKVNQIIAQPGDSAQYYGPFGESPTAGPATMQVSSLRLVK
jgi:hypothetical protein